MFMFGVFGGNRELQCGEFMEGGGEINVHEVAVVANALLLADEGKGGSMTRTRIAHETTAPTTVTRHER